MEFTLIQGTHDLVTYLEWATACSTRIVVDPFTASLHAEDGSPEPPAVSTALYKRDDKLYWLHIHIAISMWDNERTF